MLKIYDFHIDFQFWTKKWLPRDLQMSQTPRYLFSGLASLWMDGFSVSLSQMIPHVYDQLDGSGFEYLQVCAFGTHHSTDHAVWKGYFFGISMPSVIGLQMNKNQMPLTRGSLVLKLCKNSFLNPLAFIVLALWPSKVAKWQGPTRSMGYVLNCY